MIPRRVVLLLAALVPTAASAADGPKPATPAEVRVEPSRFGAREPDAAFGAFQRGLYLTAMNLARPRADAGDSAAQTLLAEIYARGLGVPQDAAAAAGWYAKAAASGVPEAQFQYALILLDGRLATRDVDRAHDLMRAAADAGNRLAQFNFAQLLIDRQPGDSGVTKAIPYYELAARQGLPDAQYAMARVLLEGVGGRRPDEVEARRWLELAAHQNYDTAQVELATLLVQSGEGEASEKAGFGWMKRAAEGGNVAAQLRLAKLYRAGIGATADKVEAGAWYIAARRAGLGDPEMDVFLSGLAPEEQKQAIERANRVR